MLEFTGERIVPGAADCEPNFARKMYQEHIARYKFASQFCVGKRVLDVGCGVGYGSNYLATEVNASVLAFDLSESAVAHARENFQHPNITYRVGDAEAFEFDEKFDVVVCFELIEHVNDAAAVVRAIKAALKDDGILIISTPRALEKKRTDFHTVEYSYDAFERLLGSAFSNRRYYFENNHFSSRIGTPEDQYINDVLKISDVITKDNCDYFIVIASEVKISQPVSSVMVINDDKYVLLLENDVEVLHKAEANLKEALQKERQALSLLQSRLEDAQTQIEDINRSIKQDEAVVKKLKRHFNDLEIPDGAGPEVIAELILAKLNVERAERHALTGLLEQSTVNLKGREDLLSSFDAVSRRQLQEISRLQALVDELKSQEAAHRAEIERYEQKQLQHADNYARQVAEQAQSYAAEIAKLAGQHAAEIARHAEEHEAQRLGYLEEARGQSTAYESHIEELTGQVSQLEEDKTRLEGEVSSAELLRRRLELVARAVAEENPELFSTIEQADVVSMVSDVIVRLNEVSVRYDDALKVIAAKDAEKEQLDQQLRQNDQLFRRLQLVADSIGREQPEITEGIDFSNPVDALCMLYLRLSEGVNDSGAVAKLEKQLKATETKLSQKEDDLQTIRLLEESLRDRMAQQVASFSEQSEMVRDLSRDVEVLRRAEAHFKEQIAIQANALAEHERALKAMRSSTSWKISAPLRAISYLFQLPIRLNRFRRENGNRALLALMSRKMGGQEPLPGDGTAVQYKAEPTATARLKPSAVSATSGQYDYDVIMLIGCWEGESKRYRVYNVAQGLTEIGRSVKIHPFSDLRDIITHNWRARKIVFFRSPFEPSTGVGDLIAHARKNGIETVFDIDDLVFDMSIIDNVHGYHHLDEREKYLYVDGVKKYRRLLLSCDWVTVTTPALVRAVEALGKRAELIPNGINNEQVELANGLLASGRPLRPRLTIGYFSGSRTHERDFAQAEGALLRLMAERPDWDLLLVGMLELGDHWAPYTSRVKREGFLPYLDMLKVLSSCHINIAPLELGDIFCEAKSELKFFEAGLVEVPTVASATEPYALAIENGVDGFAVRTEAEWYAALAGLIDSPELRQRIGQNARTKSLSRFGPSAITNHAAKALAI